MMKNILKINKTKIILTLVFLGGYFLYQYQKQIIFRGCTIQDVSRPFLCDLWDLLGVGFYTWNDTSRTLFQIIFVLVIFLISYLVASLVSWVYTRLKNEK